MKLVPILSLILILSCIVDSRYYFYPYAYPYPYPYYAFYFPTVPQFGGFFPSSQFGTLFGLLGRNSPGFQRGAEIGATLGGLIGTLAGK